MLRVEEFGVNLPWREEVTTNDEDLSRDITGEYFDVGYAEAHEVEFPYREDGGLVASTFANSWLNTQIRLL